MVTKNVIRKHLKDVIDPELGVNIVDLGLVYDIKVNKNGSVKLLMTLTSPGCPLAGMFESLIKDSLKGIEGFDPDKSLNITLTFDPPWLPDMMTEETRAELGFD
jgi:metal-sulfur cluster biosynthetic enzyme